MARNRHTSEQIIGKLREAEVELAKGTPVAQACKKIGVTEQTYYRWRKEYGGLKVDQAKRLKALELENARLKWWPRRSWTRRSSRRRPRETSEPGEAARGSRARA
jgi:hypothetical protein